MFQKHSKGVQSRNLDGAWVIEPAELVTDCETPARMKECVPPPPGRPGLRGRSRPPPVAARAAAVCGRSARGAGGRPQSGWAAGRRGPRRQGHGPLAVPHFRRRLSLPDRLPPDRALRLAASDRNLESKFAVSGMVQPACHGLRCVTQQNNPAPCLRLGRRHPGAAVVPRGRRWSRDAPDHGGPCPKLPARIRRARAGRSLARHGPHTAAYTPDRLLSALRSQVPPRNS